MCHHTGARPVGLAALKLLAVIKNNTVTAKHNQGRRCVLLPIQYHCYKLIIVSVCAAWPEYIVALLQHAVV